MDLSSNNVTPCNNKEWTPFDDFKEFEEASRRRVTDDTIKLAHLEGKRVRIEASCCSYTFHLIFYCFLIIAWYRI